MSIYLFECVKCKEEFEEYCRMDDRHKVKHCGKKAKQLITASMVAPTFREYQAIGLPGKPWIKSKLDHRNQLRRHNKEEVGNDSSMAPCMNDEEFKEIQHTQRKEMAEDLKVMKEAEKLLGA